MSDTDRATGMTLEQIAAENERWRDAERKNEGETRTVTTVGEIKVERVRGVVFLADGGCGGLGLTEGQAMNALLCLDQALHPWGKPGEVPEKNGDYWVCDIDLEPVPVLRVSNSHWYREDAAGTEDFWHPWQGETVRYRIRWNREISDQFKALAERETNEMKTGLDDGPPNGFMDECPKCGRHFARTKSGQIRRHQYQGDRCPGRGNP